MGKVENTLILSKWGIRKKLCWFQKKYHSCHKKEQCLKWGAVNYHRNCSGFDAVIPKILPTSAINADMYHICAAQEATPDGCSLKPVVSFVTRASAGSRVVMHSWKTISVFSRRKCRDWIELLRSTVSSLSGLKSYKTGWRTPFTCWSPTVTRHPTRVCWTAGCSSWRCALHREMALISRSCFFHNVSKLCLVWWSHTLSATTLRRLWGCDPVCRASPSHLTPDMSTHKCFTEIKLKLQPRVVTCLI